MRQLAVLFVILSGVISNRAFGDDYILREEYILYKHADLQSVKDLQSGVPGADAKKLKGQVVHRMEMLVQSGSRFFTKTVVGKTTTTIRCELQPMPEPGRFQLVFRREVQSSSGHFLQTDDGRLIDIAPITSSAINGPVELDKPIFLERMFTERDKPDDNFGAEKGDVMVFSIRLEPAKSPE